MALSKNQSRKKIHRRIRKNIQGTARRPRLSIYRSNRSIYCQLIDDRNGVTLASAQSSASDSSKIDQAKQVGKAIAESAKKLNVSAAVFDRGGYLYHGRVKALAEGAREGGLQF